MNVQNLDISLKQSTPSRTHPPAPRPQFSHTLCLSAFGLLEQNTIGQVASEQQTLIPGKFEIQTLEDLECGESLFLIHEWPSSSHKLTWQKG